jgi:cell division protein FtsB
MRIGFAGEILIFCWVYFLGQQGMRTIAHMRQENVATQHAIGMLKEDVAGLEFEIKQWQTNMAYKEKYAREQLQMARAGEFVYLRN